MLFNYRYSGSSAIADSAHSTAMSFAPDTLREPTFFSGRLNRHIPFREAISALHDVVTSDLRIQPKDRTAYLEWAAEQEDIWLAEFMASHGDVSEQLAAKRQELQALDTQRSEMMRPFYAARQKYFNYLWRRNKTLWWILDPVITVHPDELFFECFSEDESSYGRLACSHNVFDSLGEMACGTTNIDYSRALYDEFQKIRDYKTTDLQVDPGGFDVKTENEDDYREVKIDLPESWVRGFLQVSSAMTLPGYTFDLHPMDVHNFCFILKRRQEKKGPRSIRFHLTPGEPVTAVFEPWNIELKCPRSIYLGEEAAEIRIWGRRRLLILERLIPITKRFQVTLLGSGMPSFYMADLGDMTFTLGLSGWTANDWSRSGNFDLMAPRAEVPDATKFKVFQALGENWFEGADSLAQRLSIPRAEVHGALASWVQAGRAIYDLNKDVYRVRELSRDPLPVDKLRFSNEREEIASSLASRGAVQPGDLSQDNGVQIITAGVKDKDGQFDVCLRVDADERLVGAQCSCNFYKHNKLHKGPCEHMLATRIAFNRRDR